MLTYITTYSAERGLISAGQAMAIKRAGFTQMGLAVGSFFLLVDFGTGIGPIILSPLTHLAGYAAMFTAGIV